MLDGRRAAYFVRLGAASTLGKASTSAGMRATPDFGGQGVLPAGARVRSDIATSSPWVAIACRDDNRDDNRDEDAEADPTQPRATPYDLRWRGVQDPRPSGIGG